MTESKPATGRFAGLTAIVTGASRGIGLAIAGRLVAMGGRVVLSGRGSEALAEAVESLRDSDVALGIAGHVGDTDHQSVVALALDVFGRIDVLVNNTGINPVYSPPVDIDTEIRAIKIATPATVQWILDKAIQVHGAGGLSQDFKLASMYAVIRSLRFADGPDEVHKNALARSELLRQSRTEAPIRIED
jgi:NAD(P)-dependent dehydrogenase (short-subunit alcohol dehydrogenase family)